MVVLGGHGDLAVHDVERVLAGGLDQPDQLLDRNSSEKPRVSFYLFEDAACDKFGLGFGGVTIAT